VSFAGCATEVSRLTTTLKTKVLVGEDEPNEAMTREAFKGVDEVRSWLGRSLCV